MDLTEQFKTLFRCAIKDGKMTRQEAADKIGCHISFIDRMLSGNGGTTTKTIQKVSDALGYEPELTLIKKDG